MLLMNISGRPVPRTAEICKFTGMVQLVYVALGGALGAALRYGIASWINVRATDAMPYGTLAVNLLGSLAIGWLWGVFSHQAQVPLRLQLFLVTGLLGGFTTFSSFSLENWQLLQQGHVRTFLVYVLISNAGGLLLAVLGYRLSGGSLHFS